MMLAEIKSIVWGLPTACVILAFGVFFTFALRLWKIKKPMAELKRTLSSGNGISGFAAMSTALGGTVGIGSITGVGLSLTIGGPGSIFWMWVCGAFCCAIKYAEVSSAVLSRRQKDGVYVGGAMYSLSDSGHKIPAYLFALLGVCASCGTGAMTQSAAVGDIMRENGIPGIVTGIALAASFIAAVSGGQKRIAAVSEAVVPVAGIVYIMTTAYLICANISSLPSAFSGIISSAFGVRAIAGGAAGTAVSAAIRTGVTRCIFSNEAGMGTSPMAHAASVNATPRSQGILGVAEIVADTFVFSTLTALALLCSGTDDVSRMFSDNLGLFGRIILPVMLVIFAYAASISWNYYAESCIGFLFPNGSKAAVYAVRITAAVFVAAGACADVSFVWDMADITNALMIFPNLLDLFIRRKEIIKWTGTR